MNNIIYLYDENNQEIIGLFDVENVKGKLKPYYYFYFDGYKNYIKYLLNKGAIHVEEVHNLDFCTKISIYEIKESLVDNLVLNNESVDYINNFKKLALQNINSIQKTINDEISLFENNKSQSKINSIERLIKIQFKYINLYESLGKEEIIEKTNHINKDGKGQYDYNLSKEDNIKFEKLHNDLLKLSEMKM